MISANTQYQFSDNNQSDSSSSGQFNFRFNDLLDSRCRSSSLEQDLDWASALDLLKSSVPYSTALTLNTNIRSSARHLEHHHSLAHDNFPQLKQEHITVADNQAQTQGDLPTKYPFDYLDDYQTQLHPLSASHSMSSFQEGLVDPEPVFPNGFNTNQRNSLMDIQTSIAQRADDKDDDDTSESCGNDSLGPLPSTFSSKSRHDKRFNLDPVKRSRSEPGTSLNDVIKCGIDIEMLEPHVLKRMKNTDSARRSRIKRQERMKSMELKLEYQGQELTKLKDAVSSMANEIRTFKHQSEIMKRKFVLLSEYLKQRDILIPSELHLLDGQSPQLNSYKQSST